VTTPVLLRIDEIAEDVGRLRRRLTDEYGIWLVDRISFGVEALDALEFPTASDLYRDGVTAAEALEVVDARADHLRRLLGKRP
jgi:hypothetical protein